MTTSRLFRLLTTCAVTAATLALAACGGGGGGGGSVAASGGIIGGTGFKGPVANATVTAYAVIGGSPGAQLGSATTDATGKFSVSIGSYAGPVMLQLAGGSYTDEATGTTMNMAAGDVMTAVLPTVASGASVSGIMVTPLTSMAQTAAQHLSGGMTDANIGSANSAIGSYFMVNDILHTQPMNPLVPGSGSATTQDAINYGMSLAAMSEYAKGIGMPVSSAFVTAMMNDASDGMMNGKMGGNPISMSMGGMMGPTMMQPNAGTSGMGAAMANFAASAQNRSGITASMMQALINQLNASTGQLFPTSPTVTKGAVAGTVFNGPMKQATVRAYAINNGAMGAQIASTSVDAQGGFSLPIGSYAGPVMLQVVGATYTDEATGTAMTFGTSDTMTMAIPTVASGAAVGGLWVTPLTAMAQARASAMVGGMTDANIAAANTAVGNYFMVGDLLHVQPMNTTVPGSGAMATPDMKNCGAAIAAMSQYAKGIAMPMSYAFDTAIINDAMDGMMDGKAGGSPVSMSMGGMMGSAMMQTNAGTSGLATAMSNFLGSAANLSGVSPSDMGPLIQKLNASNGQL